MTIYIFISVFIIFVPHPRYALLHLTERNIYLIMQVGPSLFFQDVPVKRFSKFKHEPMHIWKCDSCLSVVPFPPKIMFPYVGLLKSCRCYVNTGNRLFCWEQQGVNLQRHTEPVAQNELTPFYNNRVSQMQAHHAACCELAGDRNRLPEVLYVFSINRNIFESMLHIHALWHFDMSVIYIYPQRFRRVKFVIIPPCFI